MNKEILDTVITTLLGIIKLIEVLDPKAAENKVVVDLNMAISALQELGL